MTGDISVALQNISKSYILFNRPQDRLKESLLKYFGRTYGRVFWALHEVSFQLRRGEVLGIIGRNGSGKSTLLQIISGTLQPSSGILNVNGRLAAILELGSGFNPEFTGRENIFLNGSILGLTNQEIKDRLSQIIDFAELGEFIDQPVKIYSSGMYVRLAFAIASSIDPEILIIDEALAVGDGGFVIKCMNRMKQLKERGTSILLATHDIQTVRSFCDYALWLNNGQIESSSTPNQVTSQYIQFLFSEQKNAALLQGSPASLEADINIEQGYTDLSKQKNLVRWGSGEIKFMGCNVRNSLSQNATVFDYCERIHISLVAETHMVLHSDCIGFGIALRNQRGLDVITSTTLDQGKALPPLSTGQRLLLSFEFENILAPGEYALVVNIEDRQSGTPRYLDFIENAVILKTLSPMHIFSLVLPPVEQTIQIIPPG